MPIVPTATPGFRPIVTCLSGMGVLDKVSAAFGGDPDANRYWRIIAKEADGTAAAHPPEIEDGEWRWDSDPPDKNQFEYQYGDVLENGITYACLPAEGERPLFDEIKWSITVDDPTMGRNLDETEELRQIVREEVGGMPMGDDMEDALVQMIAKEQGPGAALKELKEMKALENGNQTDFFEQAELGDPSEVATAGLMNLFRDYESVGDAVGDVIGGALDGVDGPGVGPGAATDGQQGGQQRREAPPADGEAQAQGAAATDWEPGSRERFEQAADQDGAADPDARSEGMTAQPDPEDALDLSTEPSDETREAFEDAMADGGEDDVDEEADA